MNLKERLRHLSQIGSSTRNYGKTEAIAKAAKDTGGIVIAHNFEMARYITKAFNVTSKAMSVNLLGFSGPFFFDHHAISILLDRAARKIEMLEHENAKLKEENQDLVNRMD